MPEDGWSEDLRWYAAAVHQMKLLTPGLDQYRPLALRANFLAGLQNPTAAQNQELGQILDALPSLIEQWGDPRSLGYQAQVHATYMLDPTAWPSHLGTQALWHECAHGNWFFLPWHRGYLLEYEAIARAHIEALQGPHETWALPYWNSSDYLTDPNAATLPLALRDAVLPADVDIPGVDAGPEGQRPNPLHEPSRRGPRPLQGPPSFVDWPDASLALQRAHFANAEDDNLVSFGGGYLEDLRFFHSSSELGQMDMQPHGQGHVRTGGFMASFFTAGLDPVFWMHHANVDRLWETYARDLGHGYPFPDGRPAGQLAGGAFDSWTQREFRFLRSDGSVKAWTAPGVLDTEALGYTYELITRPQFNPIPPPPAGGEVNPFGVDKPFFAPVSASSDVRLAEARTIELTGGDEDDGAVVLPGQRWNVRFDGIRSECPAQTSYAVYLGLDDDQAPDESRLLGALSLFGVFESSLERNGAIGSSRLMEATSVVGRIADFNPLAARLTLIPTEPDRQLDTVGLVIERISLEVA
jgi:tyrosinase